MSSEPTHEGPSPYHSGLTTHRGRREDCTGPDCGPAEPEQPATLAGTLRSAADRIDAEDLPQTAEDTADFHDGARWATAQLRRIADGVGTGPAGDATPDWLVDLARRYAPVALNSAERAMLRYALELADGKIASEPDEFPAVDRAAAESLRRLVGEDVAPEYTESAIYQVVGDWGVDGADSAEEARENVRKSLLLYPKCGAYAQQRIVREWEDGSEFYGPWTPLTPLPEES